MEQRRLAAAGRAHYRDELALFDLDGNAAKCGYFHLADHVRFGEIFGPENWVHLVATECSTPYSDWNSRSFGPSSPEAFYRGRPLRATRCSGGRTPSADSACRSLRFRASGTSGSSCTF